MLIKILQVVDKLSLGGSTIHGVSRLFSWWVPRFNQDLFDVRVCTLRNRDKAGAYLESLGIKVYYLNKGKFDPFTFVSLIRLVKQYQFDVLHLHGYGSWTFGRLASLFTGVPFILHEHMVDKAIPFYQKYSDKILSSMPNNAIAVSEKVKEFMIEHRGLSASDIKVLVNGIPMDEFRSDLPSNSNSKSSPYELRSKLAIPPSDRIVGTVGRLHPLKGNQYFLEAASAILDAYRNVTFLIVGDGELRGSLEELTQQLGIQAKVRFTGYQEHVGDYLRLMDIMVIPSIMEGGPLTLIEAMASQCAIVATETIGLKYLIEEGKNGFLVKAQDSNTLASKIELLLADAELCESIADNAAKLPKDFDISHTVSEIEDFYKSVVKIEFSPHQISDKGAWRHGS